MKRLKGFFLWPILFILSLTLPCISYANFYTTPNKVSLASNENVTTMYLVNQSDQPYAFVIESVDFKMNSKGQIKQLSPDKTFSFSAKDKVRFLPKAIKLGPKERGAIKIIRAKKSGILHGSYHVHLNIKRKALTKRPVLEKAGKNKTAIHIEVEYDINIPLFIDYGTPKPGKGISFKHALFRDKKDRKNYTFKLDIKNKTRFLERVEVYLLPENTRSSKDHIWLSKIAAYPEAEKLKITKKIPKSKLKQKHFWLMIQDGQEILKYEKITLR
tara:strand:+ start:5691 stop:6506 length:816 start_codon:yes stop_codon:yes gene_type:complete